MIRRDQRGFTLIELIVVIVILGILAITALPRFIDISSEARISALQGLKAALVSSTTLIHAKAQLANVAESQNYVELDYNGSTVTTRYGYFAYSQDPAKAVSDIFTILDIAIGVDWDLSYEPGVTQGATLTRISPSGVNTVTDPRVLTQISRCYVEHVVPTALGEAPAFIIEDNC